MPTVIIEQDVQNAVDVILSDKEHYKTSLNWAVAYCLAAKRLKGEDLRTQCLYILNNITHWRHPQAKEVRRVLKNF